MPFQSRMLGVFGVLLGLGCAIWLGHHSRWPDVAYNAAAAKVAETAASEDLAKRRRVAAEEQLRESRKPKPAERFGRPEIATKPPFPKVEVKEILFDFGTIRVGQPMRHAFRLKNVGQAPLVLRSVPVCKRWDEPLNCEVAPGESTTYEMKWKALEASGNFAMSVTLFTNDPQRPELQLKVYGKVVEPPLAPHLTATERAIAAVSTPSIVGGAATRELVLPAEVGVWEPVLEFTLDD
jgi:hypothetical protein